MMHALVQQFKPLIEPFSVACPIHPINTRSCIAFKLEIAIAQQFNINVVHKCSKPRIFPPLRRTALPSSLSAGCNSPLFKTFFGVESEVAP